MNITKERKVNDIGTRNTQWKIKLQTEPAADQQGKAKLLPQPTPLPPLGLTRTAGSLFFRR